MEEPGISAPASAPIDAVSSPVVAVNSYDDQRSADRFDENLDIQSMTTTNASPSSDELRSANQFDENLDVIRSLEDPSQEQGGNTNLRVDLKTFERAKPGYSNRVEAATYASQNNLV